MKKLFLFMAMLGVAFGADAANDLIISQRKADNSGNIQRNVAPTARGFFTFDASKIPASTTDLTYTTPTLSVPDAFAISSAGAISITAGGSGKDITIANSTGGSLIINTTVTSFPVTAASSVFKTGSTGGAYPFTESGHLVLQPRASGAIRDVVIAGGNPSAVIAVFKGSSGTLVFDTSGTDNGNGRIQIASSAKTNGLALGTRATEVIYRSANDTINIDSNLIIGTASLSRSAWGISGIGIRTSGAGTTYTDTTSSGTVASIVVNSYGANVLAASSTTTFTNAANVYIGGDPTAGTNVTLTNSYGLWNAGKTRLDGAVVLPSTNTSGLQLYNTVDQTTNYERLEALWSGNIGIIRTAAGGTGTGRALRLNAVNSGTLTIATGTGSTTGALQWNGGSTSLASSIMVSIGGQTSTATSGTNIGLSITPTYNQASGNAANTDLLINRTQTAVGSGAQLLIDAQVGGVSQHAITNGGAMIVSQQALTGAGAVNVTQYSTALTTSGVAQALTLANGIAGQIKTIIHVVDGGSAVLTPTTKIGFSTVTFTNAGDSVTLQYTAAGWAVTGSYGAVIAP